MFLYHCVLNVNQLNKLLLIFSKNIGTGRGCEQTGVGLPDSGYIALTLPVKPIQPDNKSQADRFLSGARLGKAVVSLRIADMADIA